MLKLNYNLKESKSRVKNTFQNFKACLSRLTVRANSTERHRRVPDGIGIGAHKSGTGALSFLDCHPNIVFRCLEDWDLFFTIYAERVRKSFKRFFCTD